MTGARAGGGVEPIRVQLLDDHEMVMKGLAVALDGVDDIEVVGTSTSIADAVATATAHTPDVALVDYRLGDGTGADATTAIRDASPNTAVVVITAFDTPDIVAASIEAGCAGFLRKNESLDVLVQGVRVAASGEALFSPDLLAGLVDRLRNPTPRSGTDLSARELQVLRLLAEGNSVEAIADQLFISQNTTRNHIQKILTKLGVHSRLEAVATALRDGLISPEELQGPPT